MSVIEMEVGASLDKQDELLSRLTKMCSKIKEEVEILDQEEKAKSEKSDDAKL